MQIPTGKLAHVGALTTESPLRDLAAIVRSRIPLIAVESNEEPQIVALVGVIARQLQLRAFTWSVTEGLRAFNSADQPSEGVVKSQEVLRHIKSSQPHCLYMLLDFHPYMTDNVHVRF